MMKLLRAGMEWKMAATRWAALAGAFLMAGCGSRALSEPQLTGNQGGLLPGMTLPKEDKPAAPAAAPGYSGIIQQTLPDGQILAKEFLNGQLLTQTWYSSLRLPERAVYYIDGGVIGGVSEFGPDGSLTKRTYYYVGSNQPQRIDEYADGKRVVRFTTFWTNGNKHIVSEMGLPSPAGPINRVQEWYANGLPKSDTSIHVELDANGQPIQEEKQGRQKAWDENGYLISDLGYDQGQAVYDYIKKAKISQR